MNYESPLIEITRDEKRVVIQFHKGPLNSTFFFSYDCGSEHYADLLKWHFKERLESIIESIRKEEYERGYKEGRGKKAKKGWFSSWLRKGDA